MNFFIGLRASVLNFYVCGKSKNITGTEAHVRPLGACVKKTSRKKKRKVRRMTNRDNKRKSAHSLADVREKALRDAQSDER